MTTLRRFSRHAWVQSIGLALVCFLVLFTTVVPSLYSLDSAEFAIGASELGIVHAPGYPLYLLLTHGFAHITGGSVDYATNLFSALSLALIAPFLYALLTTLLDHRWAAASATLAFMWSYYVWAAGIVAEIYAAQMFTLVVVVCLLTALYRRRDHAAPPSQLALLTGGAFGVAVAMHPVSILFAPGVIVAFRLTHVRWRTSFIATGLAALVFGSSLLYFPLRYSADPALNLAGTYNAAGVFEPVNLRSLHGIWWMLSGQQFANMFFVEGIIPSWQQVRTVLDLFWANTLGVGLIIGGIGMIVAYQTERTFFLIWAALIIPYTYFYTGYGVADLETMFGPTYLLWTVMIGYGLRWLWAQLPHTGARALIVVGLPALLLVTNYPLLDLSDDHSVPQRAEHLMDTLPADAVVMGHWWDITPLQYLSIVEGYRPDLTLYNRFLFDSETFDRYFEYHLRSSERPLILLGNAVPDVPDTVPLAMEPLLVRISQTGQVTERPVIAGFVFTAEDD